VADTTIGCGFDSVVARLEALPQAVAIQAESPLVESLRQGAEEAYEALIERFQQPVYNLVYRLVEDPSESCDVVQEVFLKVFRNIRTFHGKSTLKTWIYRIAVNEAHNHRRWFGRHRKHEVGLEADEGEGRSYGDVLPDPGRSPFDLALSRETSALIEEALSRLNPIFRSAVVLRDVEDLSYEEIAEILQVSLGTVKSRILRGREALRKALEDRLEKARAFGWAPEPAAQD
jgi:RNA polymerase sigma-70 factor (ECF subfamily)